MIHHSLPGQKGFELLQESFYQNSTCQRSKAVSDKKLLSHLQMSMKRASASSSSGSSSNHLLNHQYQYHSKMPQDTEYSPSHLNTNSHSNSNLNLSSNSNSKDQKKQNSSHHHHTSNNNNNHHHPDENHNGIEPPPPPLPLRSSSLRPKNSDFRVASDLMTGTTTAARNPYKQSMRESMTNPKRISIATSTFWAGDPDLGHFVSGWEVGRDETNSVWTTERDGDVSKNYIWGDAPAIKKGILLHQSDKLWSRWKERYCILTRDYIHCFRRSTSIHRHIRLSDMGVFIFKLRLADIESIAWQTRKSGPIIELVLTPESSSRLRLRCITDTYESLNSWYTLLQECVYMSKERRRALRNLFLPSTTSSSCKTKAMSTLTSHRSSIPTSTINKKSGEGRPNNSSQSEDSPTSTCSNSNSTSNSSSSHLSQDLENLNLPRRYPSSKPASKSKSKASGDDHNNNVRKSIPNTHDNYSLLRKSSQHVVDEEEEDDDDDDDENNDNEDYDKFGDHSHNHNRNTNGLDALDDDDDYYDDNSFIHIPVNKNSRSSIAIDTTGTGGHRSHNINGLPTHVMSLNDFVKNPWKSSSAKSGFGLGNGGTLLSMSGYSMPRDSLQFAPSHHHRSNNNNHHATSQSHFYPNGNSNSSHSHSQSHIQSSQGGTFSRSSRDPNITFRKMT